MQLVLDHASTFIGTNDVIKPEGLLKHHLRGQSWTVESVALLLRRSGTQELAVQNLTNCLHSAIYGSFYADESGLKPVLILLIEAGANVYERDSLGITIFDIVLLYATNLLIGRMVLYFGMEPTDIAQEKIMTCSS